MLARIGRRGLVIGLALGLGSVTLLFLGCLHLRPDPPPPTVTADRLLRVRLGGRGPRQEGRLEVVGWFTATDFSSGEVLAGRGTRRGAVMVRPAAGKGIDFGSRHFNCDDILIRPERDASIVLNNQTYRGLLRIRRYGDGLVFDNHLDIESYLRGVLRGELPRYFHPQAFKAQAVAARSYALYQKRNGSPNRAFDVYDSESSQVYIGVRGEDRVAVQAIEQTRGEVCVWNDNGTDKMFCTYYSSACGGCSQHVNNVKPRDPDVSPLAGNVRCSDCYLARFYRWDPVTLSKAELTKRLVACYPVLARLGRIVALQPVGTTADGRIIRIRLRGAAGRSDTLVGEDFRLAVGGRTLKSTNFDIEAHEDQFVFKNGRGYGHGIGLCQHGMETKARRGMDYKRILAIYYPGATVKKTY
jgi:stage II sporulation protein D